MSSSPGRCESPVVDLVFRKKEQWRRSRQGLYWAMINLILAVFVLIEISSDSMASHYKLTHPALKIIECVAATVLLLSVGINLIRYIWPYITGTTVEVTEAQMRLLAIRNSDRGFRLSPSKPHTAASSPKSSSEIRQSVFKPGQTGIFTSSQSSVFGSPQSSTFSYNLTQRWSRSPSSNLTSSPSTTANNPFLLHGHLNSPSPTYQYSSFGPQRYSPYASLNQSSFSPNQSMAFERSMNMSASSVSPVYGGYDWPNTPTTGIHSRSTRITPSRSPKSPAAENDRITDLNSLSQYLKEYDEKEYKTQLSTLDTTTAAAGGGTSFWNFARSFIDYTNVLRKNKYQISSRSAQSATSRNRDDVNQGHDCTATEFWQRFGVSENTLTLWIENLRKWICLTVILRLSRQIDSINNDLWKISCEDMQIGEVSIATLKQLALTKSQFLPFLNTVIPYLDVSTNQEYAVKRIKHLSEGGCMSDFDWNGGGNYGQQWAEHLPTDSALVMHCLCSYLDSRLPADPKYPDGKTFTNQHFCKTPDKPSLKKDSLWLCQSRINPPQFDVIIGEETWVLPKGRNNLFHAILFFLYHIATKEHGMLGRVNLGMSGVNILWVLDSKV